MSQWWRARQLRSSVRAKPKVSPDESGLAEKLGANEMKTIELGPLATNLRLP